MTVLNRQMFRPMQTQPNTPVTPLSSLVRRQFGTPPEGEIIDDVVLTEKMFKDSQGIGDKIGTYGKKIGSGILNALKFNPMKDLIEKTDSIIGTLNKMVSEQGIDPNKAAEIINIITTERRKPNPNLELLNDFYTQIVIGNQGYEQGYEEWKEDETRAEEFMDTPVEVERQMGSPPMGEQANANNVGIMEGFEQGASDEAMIQEGMIARDAIDKTDTYDELMRSIRGDDLTEDDRRQELAAIVGEKDAYETPDSVLALVQPVIQMLDMEESQQGIGATDQAQAMNMPIEQEEVVGIQETMAANGGLIKKYKSGTAHPDAGAEKGDWKDWFLNMGGRGLIGGNTVRPDPHSTRGDWLDWFLKTQERRDGGIVQHLAHGGPVQYFNEGTGDWGVDVQKYYDQSLPIYEQLLGGGYDKNQTIADILLQGVVPAAMGYASGDLTGPQAFGAGVQTSGKIMSTDLRAKTKHDQALKLAALQGAFAKEKSVSELDAALETARAKAAGGKGLNLGALIGDATSFNDMLIAKALNTTPEKLYEQHDLGTNFYIDTNEIVKWNKPDKTEVTDTYIVGTTAEIPETIAELGVTDTTYPPDTIVEVKEGAITVTHPTKKAYYDTDTSLVVWKTEKERDALNAKDAGRLTTITVGTKYKKLRKIVTEEDVAAAKEKGQILVEDKEITIDIPLSDKTKIDRLIREGWGIVQETFAIDPPEGSLPVIQDIAKGGIVHRGFGSAEAGEIAEPAVRYTEEQIPDLNLEQIEEFRKYYRVPLETPAARDDALALVSAGSNALNAIHELKTMLTKDMNLAGMPGQVIESFRNIYLTFDYLDNKILGDRVIDQEGDIYKFMDKEQIEEVKQLKEQIGDALADLRFMKGQTRMTPTKLIEKSQTQTDVTGFFMPPKVALQKLDAIADRLAKLTKEYTVMSGVYKQGLDKEKLSKEDYGEQYMQNLDNRLVNIDNLVTAIHAIQVGEGEQTQKSYTIEELQQIINQAQ